MTAKHYVRLSVADKARALEKMPDFHPGKPESESMRATGTDQLYVSVKSGLPR